MLLDLKKKGPSVQDKAVQYPDLHKMVIQAVNILSKSDNPEQSRVSTLSFFVFVFYCHGFSNQQD